MKPYISVPVVAFGREFKLQINSHIENHRLTRARVQVLSLEFLSINLRTYKVKMMIEEYHLWLNCFFTTKMNHECIVLKIRIKYKGDNNDNNAVEILLVSLKWRCMGLWEKGWTGVERKSKPNDQLNSGLVKTITSSSTKASSSSSLRRTNDQLNSGLVKTITSSLTKASSSFFWKSMIS